MNNTFRFALFALMLFGLSFAGLSISEYTVTPSVVGPGDSGVLVITVSNGALTDTVTNVVINVKSTSGLGIDRSFVVGDLEASSSVMISIPFTVATDATDGYYTVDVRATGRTEEYYLGSDNQLKSKTSSFEKSASIPVAVVNEPVITVALSEESIEDITEETFTFTNSGGSAKNVRVTILNEGIGFLNQDQIYVSELSNSDSVSTTLDARGAEEGATKLQLSLTYQNALGTQINETKEIPITVKKEEGDFVFTQNAPVVTGKNENLQLTITNEGKPMTDVRFTFADSEVRLRGINEVKVGDLASGESKSITVPIVADLEPGTQNAELDLKWVESGEHRLGSVTIPLEVISDANVGVFLEAKPAPLQAGQEHTISVTVSNLGSHNIEGTTVELGSEAMELLTIQPQQYIGGLDSDDFSSVQYKVLVKDVAPGTYPATVSVSFRDASGQWDTITKEIVIAVVEPPAAEGSIVPMAIGAIIIIGVLYWWFKKRKK